MTKVIFLLPKARSRMFSLFLRFKKEWNWIKLGYAPFGLPIGTCHRARAGKPSFAEKILGKGYVGGNFFRANLPDLAFPLWPISLPWGGPDFIVEPYSIAKKGEK